MQDGATSTAATRAISPFVGALPYWMSLALPPLAVIGAIYGGWTVFLLPVCTWYLFSLLDAVIGLNTANADTGATEAQLFWYRIVTLIWFPVQFLLIFSILAYVTATGHLATWEKVFLFIGIGVVSGTVGINYSHELMHQKNRSERWLADLLLACVLYSHFRSEHLLVHHPYIGTPRDPVTARYNEGFHRFFFRVLHQCRRSAFRAEAAMQARRGRRWTHRSNPFWRYWALQVAMLGLAFLIGGLAGLGLFVLQAAVAVWVLELTNYVEHYGLTRKYLGDGRFEHIRPHHSWNAAHRMTNWLLINLQRHSDHHYKPDRRFPLLQTYDDDVAPNLPASYAPMTIVATIPPLWRRIMNPRVRAWRRKFYPEIEDWSDYNGGTLPQPKGAPG